MAVSPQPKRSETDPPAANQPLGEDIDEDTDDAGQPQQRPATGTVQPPPAPISVLHRQIPPGKPDGEVDTRP
jgi:hypothetical protein